MYLQTKNSHLPDRGAAEKIYRELLPHYENILQQLQRRLKELIDGRDLSVTVKSRVKRFNNYCEKLVRISKLQGCELLEITDLLGIRIICPFLEDLVTVEQLISEHFEILELEHKAEQHSFREFGYDSVHLLIRAPLPDSEEQLPHSSAVCEIQLRTILQEAWAEVEHELVYKSDIDLPNHSIRRKLAALNASLTLSDLTFQEIRDTQKEIRRRGQQRRQLVDSFACDCGGIHIAQLPEFERAKAPVEESEPEEATPKKLEQLMLSALDKHSGKEFDKAIELYGIILRMKLDPAIRALVYNHRGMARFALNEYDLGLEDFSRAIEFNEDYNRAWNNRGLACRVLGKYDQSLLNYNRAIELGPQQYEGYWGRAQTYFEMKLYSQALNDCRSTLERNANFAPARELEQAIRQQLF